MATREELEQIRHVLQNDKTSGKRCLVGFDGFVDSMYRPVRKRVDEGTALYYDTIASFGDRIIKSAGKSSDTEIALTDTRAGGNGPLLSLALAAAGLQVTCMGMLGKPVVQPVFSLLKDVCRCVSLGNPSQTIAFEFQDGKLMFGCQSGQSALTWEGINSMVGKEQMDDMLQESQLIALVNWSYLWHMNLILDGILASIADAGVSDAGIADAGVSAAGQNRNEDMLPNGSDLCEKTLFFDLSDISGRSPEDIHKMIHAIGNAAKCFKTVMGLNENEALTLAQAVGLPGEEGLPEMAAMLREKTGVDVLAIHSLRESVAVDFSGTEMCRNVYVENPLLSTGGGDNFNGGLCLGLLSGLPLRHCLVLAGAAASLYVSTGESPGAGKLLQFLQAHLEA